MCEDSVSLKVLSQLREKKETLLMKTLCFGDECGKLLLEELLKDDNSHVHTLRLCSVEIDADGARCLGELLAKSSRLKSFCLRESSLDSRMLTHITRGIGCSNSLAVVELCYANIDDSKVDLLREMLRESQSLRELDVRRNYLRESAAAVVEAALEHNRLTKINTLSSLSISARALISFSDTVPHTKPMLRRHVFLLLSAAQIFTVASSEMRWPLMDNFVSLFCSKAVSTTSSGPSYSSWSHSFSFLTLSLFLNISHNASLHPEIPEFSSWTVSKEVLQTIPSTTCFVSLNVNGALSLATNFFT